MEGSAAQLPRYNGGRAGTLGLHYQSRGRAACPIYLFLLNLGANAPLVRQRRIAAASRGTGSIIPALKESRMSLHAAPIHHPRELA